MPLLCVRGLKIASEMMCVWLGNTGKHRKIQKEQSKERCRGIGDKEVSGARGDLIPTQESESSSWLQFG